MKKILLLLFPILLLPGCFQQIIPAKRLMRLSVGMSKEQVVNVLGEPNAFRGATVSANGETTELYEYLVNDGNLAWSWYYFLYFKENKLVQWGKTDDWQRTSDAVQEIRVR